MKNIVIDIETLGTKLNKNRQVPVVLSLGAVLIVDGKIADSLLVHFNPGEQIARGAFIDMDTLNWWLNTDAAEFCKLIELANASSNEESLDKFASWVAMHTDDQEYLPIWGNSHSFDCTNLEYIYTLFDREIPWSYRGESCFRTLKKLCSWDCKPTTFKGTQHNAIDDATHEAEWLINCAKELKKHI